MSTAQDMLQHIDDPNVRQQYANILNGQVIGIVRCHSKTCKGRIIGRIMADNNCVEDEPLAPSLELLQDIQDKNNAIAAKNEKIVARNAKHSDDPDYEPKAMLPLINPPIYVSGLEGDRTRLDGSRGFRCYCGNSSILHEHEQGIISGNQPTKRDLEKVFGKIQSKPTEYNEINGKVYVDGFSIEKVAE